MIYNDAYSVFAGGRHPQLLGSKVLEGWPEVADLNRRVMEVGLRGETLSFRDEHLVLYRSGPAATTSGSISTTAPCSTRAASRPGVLAIVVETTERVRAEKALRDSEAQFRTFAAAMPHHVWAATPDGKLDWFNHKVHRVHRRKRRRHCEGDGWGRWCIPTTSSVAVAAWQKALASGTVYEVEFRLRRSDGTYRWHLARAMPIRDDGGKVVRWIGTNTDIDDQIQAERALRDREADLARVQQIGKVGGVEVFLTEGFRNRRSPEYLVIHGLPPEAAQETHEDWVRRIHPEDREQTERQFLDAVKGDVRDYNAEYRIVRPNDGQVRWIAVKAEIERDAQGRAAAAGRRAHRHHRPRSSPRRRCAKASSASASSRKARPSCCGWAMSTASVSTSTACCASSGASRRRSVAGFDWSTSLHPDDAQALYSPCSAQAMRDHTPFTVEARYRRFDGEYRLVRTDAQPRFDARGEFLGMIGVNVDITETRRAEQALKESEERFRLIANSAPVPMWVSRLDGKRAFVNQAYMDFLGLGYEECLVYDWRKALHPDDLQRILQRADRGRGLQEAVRARGALSARRRGVALAALGIAAALGAGRRARRLHRRRARHHGGQAGRDRAARPERDARGRRSRRARASATASGTYRRTSWSSATATASGSTSIRPRRRAGLEPGRAARPDLGVDRASRRHRPLARRSSAHLAAGGITQRFENRLRHKDGSYRWLSWTAAAHEGLIYAAARDVTDEKEAAETLRRTEEALRQSQKMEAVGQLTGGIAHDFNNLLQGIVGSLDLVQKRLADGRLSEIQRYVNGAMTSANRAAALTHRLLAFSRRQPLDPKPLRANPLIASMEDLLRRTMGEQHPARAGAGGRPVADAVRPEPAREQHPQPGHQRPRCDARRRQAHDRDQQRASRRRLCGRDSDVDPASTSASASPTPAPA